ncbi:MAG TPA: DUF4129 domain-containing protein [Thermoleophilia bacterium]
MRSRSWLEHAGLGLGATTEGIWCGALAAALTGASWLALAVFATVTVALAAAAARRLGRGEARQRAARLQAVALILVASGVLFAAGGSWTHPNVPWQVVRDIVYVSGLVFLGISLARDSQAPEAAVRRAVRGFALLCAVLLCAALAGSAPGWASGAVVAALIAGGLLIAVVRYRALTDLVDPADRLPAWPWLLAVTGAVLGVIAVGAVLSQVLSPDVLHWALGDLWGVVRFALDGVAYVIGYAGAGLIRGIAWLLSALHLHAQPASEAPHPAATPPVLKLRHAAGVTVWSGAKVIGTAVGALVAVGLSLTLVVVALRRFRREPPADVAVVEEREALTSLRSAAGESAARLGRRLRRRLQAMRHHDALAPAELVRRRYAELERRLSRAGQPRLPGVTVRDHLATVAAPADAQPAASPDETAPSAHLQPAADLAAIYELARYSAHVVDEAQAQRFASLARAFEA